MFFNGFFILQASLHAQNRQNKKASTPLKGILASFITLRY